MPSLNHSIFWLGERRSTEQHRRPGKTSPRPDGHFSTTDCGWQEHIMNKMTTGHRAL